MRRVVMVVVCAALAGCHRAPQPPRELAVEGASNAYVTLASDGGRVAAAWAATGDHGANIYAALSDDGGRTFAAPVRVNDRDGDANPGGEQPPRVVVQRDRVVVVWVSKQSGTTTIRSSESTDAGRTFTPARSISPSGLPGARGWESATLDDAGVVHAVWLDGRNAAHHEHMAAPRQDIVHAMWRAGEAPIETSVAANVCFCCKTAVASRGTDIFVAWRHLFPGGVRDIAVAHSADGGRTFSDPVRVSPDNWKLDACPDDGPSLALGPQGHLHVAWPTLLQEGGAAHMAIFESESSDGGATFSPRVRVDANGGSASHPRVVVAESGARAIVWDELAGGQRHVMIRAGGAQPVALTADAAVGSYPAIAASSGGFVTAWTDQTGGGSVVRVARMTEAQR